MGCGQSRARNPSQGLETDLQQSDRANSKIQSSPAVPDQLTADRREGDQSATMSSTLKPPAYDEIGPPAGPLPGKSVNPHETAWQAIPDTALLPPPPSEGYVDSPVHNASENDAKRAHEWCHANALIQPLNLSPQDLGRIAQGRLQLLKPRELSGQLLSKQSEDFSGCWKIISNPRCGDCAMKTNFPMYLAVAHQLGDQNQRTIYFEVNILSLGQNAGFGMGYVAAPYPNWRLPGWQRGGVGVHSDDGRKYVNDTWGGKNFTEPFKKGERVGIGMQFSTDLSDISVFFTKNGREIKSFDIREERDAQVDVGPYGTHIEGLEGRHDLYGCVGVFDDVQLELYFEPKDWLFNPS